MKRGVWSFNFWHSLPPLRCEIRLAGINDTYGNTGIGRFVLSFAFHIAFNSFIYWFPPLRSSVIPWLTYICLVMQYVLHAVSFLFRVSIF